MHVSQANIFNPDIDSEIILVGGPFFGVSVFDETAILSYFNMRTGNIRSWLQNIIQSFFCSLGSFLQFSFKSNIFLIEISN